MSTPHLQAVFLISLAVSLALTPLLAALARRLGVVDRPGHRKTHKSPVPYLGGLALLLSPVPASLLAFFFQGDPGHILTRAGLLKAFFLLAPALGASLVGLWDDLKAIPARAKFLGQGAFALAFAVFGFRFQVLQLPGFHAVDLGLLSVPVTVFWILSVVNGFNLIDGLDGLASTVGAGCLALLAAASALAGNDVELFLVVGALGAVLGFLPYNWKPAKIYLGDAGSGWLGMFLACSLTALGSGYGQAFDPAGPQFGQPFFYQILAATLLAAYPALEITLSVVRRLLHGRPIYRADRGHIHHRLLKAGWSVQGVCLTALALTLLPGLAALATIAKYHGLASWVLVLCGVVTGLGLTTLGFLDFLKPKVLERLRPHYQVAHHFMAMQRIKLRLVRNRDEALFLVNQTCAEFGVQGYSLLLRPGKDGSEGCHFSWERSLADNRRYLDYLRTLSRQDFTQFKDRIALSGGNGEAFWLFEPHTEEGELDVEYRVLVSEFMREALERMEDLPAEPTVHPPEPGRHSHALSSALLRRRN